ncbi:NADP-dependent oxidoreductase [Herbiconiux sp. CPCC 205716]|uniref:NADP-dependent oxidoreductase n=1 Tax=Herbiconiux gentiana TaxID=2970912 RepID=A0ABT2GEB1_9MICO|nr:NADP-dependent oxidoreductase [Herbiconiux gentiana]MCS5714518.1 NADP-dependent oxidoreductase [Herbiconiux gentiana]
MASAVRFPTFGGTEVLEVVDVDRPEPGPGEVRVEVVASAINPGEAAIREGRLEQIFPTTLPSGEGSDLAGRVQSTGPGVTGIQAGDEVIGFSDTRGAHATHAVVPAENVVPKPAGVTWEEGAALYVAGTTAVAAVRAVGAAAGETLVVAGATGGVGLFAVQLAKLAGARVIGLARRDDHALLAELGVDPVEYGPDALQSIREAAPDGVDAFIDTAGHGSVDLALELGVAPERIDTVADPAAAARGVKTDGNAQGGGAPTLARLAELVAEGALRVEIDTVYPLQRVAEAYDHLASEHVVGKIVLRME